MDVIALQSIYSTVSSVGSRTKGERFACPDQLARELADYGMVSIVDATDPKESGVTDAGPMAQHASSSPADQASPKSKPTTSSKPTSKGAAKRSR